VDELQGREGVWRFDGETVSLHYRTGWRADPFLAELGRCDVPVAALSSAEFTPSRLRGKSWQLRLRLHDRVDPFSAVGAGLNGRSHPFVLTGAPQRELLAEYYADQFTAAAQAARGAAPSPAPEQLAVRLVPPLPLHVQTSEGTAFFDGETVRLVWSGWAADSAKRKQQRREFALPEIRSVEWVPSDGWVEGHLRILTHDSGGSPSAKPDKDPHCLVTGSSRREEARMLLMAATVTAHLRAREADSRRAAALPAPDLGAPAGEKTVYDRIRELGRLRDEGLLTEEEFQAKKTELLDRL